MGCGETLAVFPWGQRMVIECQAPQCSRPTAVRELLRDTETEHRVVIDDDGFTIRHPLRERLDEALLQCDFHVYLSRIPSDLVDPGSYRAVRSVSGWNFERIGD